MAAHIIDHTPARPKVSVIMLSYNSAAFLPFSISAVLRQVADFDVQLVLSDDCSTDSNTIDVCKKYADAFPRKITLITHDANQGIPLNFIDAFRACKGEYIAMCDADDYWCCDDKLRIMAGYMDRHPECAVAFHRVINLYEDNGTKSLSNGAQHKADYQLSDLCAGNFITNCSVMYRRSACPTVPPSVADLLLCDYAMHLLMASKGSIHYFNKPMAVYRKRSDALWTGVKATQRYRDALKVRVFALDLLKCVSTERNYGIMVHNYTANALSCLATAKAEGIDMPDIRSMLMQLHPQWTDADIDAKLAERIASNAAKPLAAKIRRCASALRSFASRFMPTPKVDPLLP